MSANKPIVYAGTVYFKAGVLDYWDNDTGHYVTTVAHKHQTEIAPADDLADGLLPLKKFRKFK